MKAQSCVFITDSSRNLTAGQAAGTFNIGIVTRPERTATMVEAGADFLTGDYKEVFKLLNGEPLWLAYQLNYPEEMIKQRAKEDKAARKAKKKEKEKAKAMKAFEKELKKERKEKKKKKEKEKEEEKKD